MTSRLPPALYVVATPIGNLADITLRALEILRAVDWVAAEDTRHTQPLLSHHGIDARMMAVHEHNEEAAAQAVIGKLAAGETVALVSDAGTPAISDPGCRLVARVRAAGYPVVPVPGPSAVTAALSAAGLPEGRFLFHGFLPAKSAARQLALRNYAPFAANLVFYEAPHRVLETLADMLAVFGPQRRIVVAKELSKLFETFHVCALGEAAAWFAEDVHRLKGEFVLIVEGAAETGGADEAEAEAERVVGLLLDAGLPVKQAVALAVSIAGGNRNALYRKALSLRALR